MAISRSANRSCEGGFEPGSFTANIVAGPCFHDNQRAPDWRMHIRTALVFIFEYSRVNKLI